MDNTLPGLVSRYQLDGFHVLTGLIAAIAGPVLFATGDFPLWAPVITAIGVVILWAQIRIVQTARAVESGAGRS